MKTNKPILAYDYLKGEEFIEQLKTVLNCRTYGDLAETLHVPKSTFSTWAKHERTSYELIVRLHLALGVPVEQLALTAENRVGEYKDLDFTPALAGSLFNKDRADEELAANQLQTITIKSFCLSNGKLLETGEIPYPTRRFNSFGVSPSQTTEVETNEAIYLLDESSTDAVSGKYLIDVDGRLSINQIQRLPGRKLAVGFGDSTLEVAEHDIKVLGRVAVTLSK